MFILKKEGTTTGVVETLPSRLNGYQVSPADDRSKDSVIHETSLTNCKFIGFDELAFINSCIDTSQVVNTALHLSNTRVVNTEVTDGTLFSFSESDIRGGSLNNITIDAGVMSGSIISTRFSKCHIENTAILPHIRNCRGISLVSGAGALGRTLYVYDSERGPEAIIGCFRGTVEEAIMAISEEYDGEGKELYIDSVKLAERLYRNTLRP